MACRTKSSFSYAETLQGFSCRAPSSIPPGALAHHYRRYRSRTFDGSQGRNWSRSSGGWHHIYCSSGLAVDAPTQKGERNLELQRKWMLSNEEQKHLNKGIIGKPRRRQSWLLAQIPRLPRIAWEYDYSPGDAEMPSKKSNTKTRSRQDCTDDSFGTPSQLLRNSSQ